MQEVPRYVKCQKSLSPSSKHFEKQTCFFIKLYTSTQCTYTQASKCILVRKRNTNNANHPGPKRPPTHFLVKLIMNQIYTLQVLYRCVMLWHMIWVLYAWVCFDLMYRNFLWHPNENMISPRRKVGYFGKIAEIFSTAQSAQRQQKYTINLSFYSTYLECITLLWTRTNDAENCTQLFCLAWFADLTRLVPLSVTIVPNKGG